MHQATGNRPYFFRKACACRGLDGKFGASMVNAVNVNVVQVVQLHLSCGATFHQRLVNVFVYVFGFLVRGFGNTMSDFGRQA